MPRFKCPQGYRQNPPKSGKCVETLKSKKLKQTKKTKKTKIKMSKFFNIAEDVFSGYAENGYIPGEYTFPSLFKKKDDKHDIPTVVQTYVDKHKFTPGDILYVGSTYETRQYSKAFVIITTDGKAVGYHDDAVSLPIEFRSELPDQLHYRDMLNTQFKAMFTKTGTDEDAENLEFGEWFFGFEPEKTKDKYQEKYQSVLDDYSVNNLL